MKTSQAANTISRESRLNQAITLKNLMSEMIIFLGEPKAFNPRDKKISLNKIRRYQRIYMNSGAINPSINEVFINMRRVINKQNNLFHTFRLKSYHIAKKQYLRYLEQEIHFLESVRLERFKEFSLLK